MHKSFIIMTNTITQIIIIIIILYCFIKVSFSLVIVVVSILVTKLGVLDNNVVGYQSSFMYKYQDKQSLFIQKIEDKKCQIEVFQKERIAYCWHFRAKSKVT